MTCQDSTVDLAESHPASRLYSFAMPFAIKLGYNIIVLATIREAKAPFSSTFPDSSPSAESQIKHDEFTTYTLLSNNYFLQSSIDFGPSTTTIHKRPRCISTLHV